VCGQCVGVQRMDCTVRAMTCRFGACCSSALNCPWWHSAEEIKLFKHEVELQKRKLAMRCGFCARGECRFGEDCKRAKRVEEIVGMKAKSVAPTDLGDDVCAGAGGEAKDAAVAEADNGNGRTAEKKTVDKDVGHGAEAMDRRHFVFGRRRVGVVKRPSAVEVAGGVGGAGAFGALAPAEEEVAEEEVDITFLLPKPKVKVKKEKRKEKAAVKAAVDAAEKAAEGDSGPGAAEAAVVRAGKLRDLEVLTIGSDPIDKISEETADKEKAADAAEKAVCPLVAAMLAVEAAVTSEAVKVEKENVAATAEEAVAAATAEDQRNSRGQRIQTKSLLAMKRDNAKAVETAEERAERFKKGLESCLW
jgi:hypothetical protein